MFEIKHLRTLTTLVNTGNIRKASEALFVTQSALSHQLKELEQRLGTTLFIRNTFPVQFTEQGEILLRLADDILPKISNALDELNNKKNPVLQLNLAIACHACFQWLLPVTETFLQQYPELKIEFIEQFFPEQINNKTTVKLDILFTDEKVEHDDYIYQALGSFEVVAVLPKNQETKQSYLSNKNFLSAADFSHQTLLTYPVKSEKLDIFKFFLNKEKYKPKLIKQVANSHMILQMVAANMGIAALPDWLVNSLSRQLLIQTKHIGKKGIYKTLYARYNPQSKHIDLIEQLIPQTVAAFEKLYSHNIAAMK